MTKPSLALQGPGASLITHKLQTAAQGRVQRYKRRSDTQRKCKGSGDQHEETWSRFEQSLLALVAEGKKQISGCMGVGSVGACW